MYDAFIAKIEDLPSDSHIIIEYQCSNCKKSIKTSYHNYNKRPDCMCRQCAAKVKTAIKRRQEFSLVISLFASNKYTLLSTRNEYNNAHTKLRYLCNKHGEQSISYHNLQQGRGCPKCGKESQSGENHWNWQDGITKLSRYLRISIEPWKSQQFQGIQYTCEITRTKSNGDLNVHHMTSFATIRDLTLEQLGLPVYETIGEYGDDLQLLTDTFLKNNDRFANPIVMLKSVHQEFHRFCGGTTEDTTMEQLQQFKESLKAKKSSLAYPA